jgi:hypothetical protein
MFAGCAKYRIRAFHRLDFKDEFTSGPPRCLHEENGTDGRIAIAKTLVSKKPAKTVTASSMLQPQGVGLKLLLYPASKGQKEGHSLVKLVFDVRDAPTFCKAAAANGLAFGAVHQAGGYVFANVKHPSNNSGSVFSRAFAS